MNHNSKALKLEIVEDDFLALEVDSKPGLFVAPTVEEEEEIEEELPLSIDNNLKNVDLEDEGTVEEEEERIEKQGTSETDLSESFKNVLKDLLGETFTIVQEVDGKDEEYTLDEIILDKETFQEILRSEMTGLSKKAKDSALQGLSEFAKAVIDLERKGGDVTNLLEKKRDYSDPLESIDIETLEGQQESFRLAKQLEGASEEDTELLIEKLTEKGKMAEKGEEAFNRLKTYLDDLVKHEAQLLDDKQKARKERINSYKEKVKENLETAFELEPTYRAKLLNLTYKANEKGECGIDDLYRNARRSEEETAKLVLFLANREEYDRQISQKKVTESMLESSKRASIRIKSAAINDGSKRNRKDEEAFLPLTIEK